VEVRRLCWLGTQAEDAERVVSFFRDVLGLRLVHQDPSFAMLQLPSGEHDYLEVFAAGSRSSPMSCPAVGFLVDDVEGARRELIESGVELIGEITEAPQVAGYRWQNFRAPDHHIYCVIEIPD
jgi:predicted enzyme related to lactoylglutathione lyase